MSHRGKNSSKSIHEDASVCELKQCSISLNQFKDFADDFESQVDESFHLKVRLLTEEQIA